MFASLRSASAAVILLSLCSFGQTSPKNPLLDRAVRQVEEGDFEDAIATLTRGIAEPDVTDEQLAEMYRLLGTAHLSLGHEAPAREAFEKLLQARPDYELPKATPPKLLSLYARIKDDVRKRRLSPVTLTLQPLPEIAGNAPVLVTARIENLALGTKAKFFYRRAGAQSFSSIDFAGGKNLSPDYQALLPAFEVPTENRPYEMEYYVEVADAAQRRLAGRGDAYSPLSFRVAAIEMSVRRTEPAAVPLYKNPWLWVGIGAGVAAATTATVLVLTSSPPTATLPVKIQIQGAP